MSSEISLFDRVTDIDVLIFTKHLSLLLKSGISLADGIEILREQTTRYSFRKLLSKLHQEIANGQPFHISLALFPNVFDSFYVNLVKVGEESGNLEKNLSYLAQHLKKQKEFNTKIRGALLYPSIVLGVASVAGVGLSIFVLPKLIDLFNSLDVELPLSTKILLFAAQTMRDYGVIIVFGFIVLLSAARLAIRTKRVKPLWHKITLSLPIFGTFLQDIQLASCFRNIGTMLAIGLPISAAMNAQYDTTTNIVYKSILKDIAAGLEKGATIASTLKKKHSQFVPLVAIKMIGVGEKTGKLDEIFIYLGEYYEEEVEDISKTLSTVLEPIILIAVGLIVAFIAIAIIGPIYQFTGSISRQ